MSASNDKVGFGIIDTELFSRGALGRARALKPRIDLGLGPSSVIYGLCCQEEVTHLSPRLFPHLGTGSNNTYLQGGWCSRTGSGHDRRYEGLAE